MFLINLFLLVSDAMITRDGHTQWTSLALKSNAGVGSRLPAARGRASIPRLTEKHPAVHGKAPPDPICES